jgi:hypothetical protein
MSTYWRLSLLVKYRIPPNDRYRKKRAWLKELEADPGDGWQYIWLHEKPYRFDALRRIAGRLTPARYWKLVGEVWTNSENIRQNLAGWRRLWSDPRPHKQECMEPEERAALASMPASFPVWRGVGYRGRIHGLSWTVDHEKALWFARRFGFRGPGRLVHAEVARRDVHAFFSGRQESEIVAEAVTVPAVEKIEAPVERAVKNCHRNCHPIA